MKKKVLIMVVTLVICNMLEGKENFIFSQMNDAKADSLMIVAHPDDETFWGGHHLLKENYFVVCLTNGNNRIRTAEFNRVIKETKNQGIILHFPDKTNEVRDDWKSCYDEITKEVSDIIHSRNWKKVVTHNPKGEYGHLQHQMTSSIVTSSMKEKKELKKLYYFGEYYKKKVVERKENPLKKPLTNKEMKKKQELLDLYASQKHVEKKLAHMMAYENWVSYHEWK